LIQQLAALVPPELAAAALLLATAGLTLLVGGIRRGRAFLPNVPALLFIIAGAAWFWPLAVMHVTPWVGSGLLLAAAAALLGHTAAQSDLRAEPRTLDRGAPRAARLYLVTVLLIAVVLLFYDLGGYSGTLLVWEGPVTDGFAAAFNAGQSVWRFAAEHFLWDDGILSAGHTSLFYGAPTYLLFTLAGFSPWTLRCPAVIATLLSIAVMYALGCRFFGRTVGAAAAVALGLNACVLFYGRYGSSPAGTLLAILLALWATWRFLDADRSAWWMGGVCAVALYLATLQYSPARIVVLILLGLIPLVLACQWRRLWWQRLVGLALIVIATAGVWRLEGQFNRHPNLFAARGEQFFACIHHPDCIRDTLGRTVRPEALTPFDTIELLYRTVAVTIPQYVGILTPQSNPGPPGSVIAFDPPPLPLYFGPAVLFILLGFAHSLTRIRSWRHACLLLWVCGSTVPLLLTNRVDAHRIMLFVIPLSFWAALGIWEVAQVLQDAQMPRVLQHLFAAALVLTVVWSDANLLYFAPVAYQPRVPYSTRVPYYPRISLPLAGESLAGEIATVPGPVAVGTLIDHRDVGWMQLTMLERARHDPTRTGTLLPEGLLVGIKDNGGPDDVRMRELQGIIKTTTVLLAPATEFQRVAAIMQHRGVRVSERSSGNLRLLRLDAGAAATGIADQDIQPLPTIVLPPTPTPIPLSGGPHMSLTTMTPTTVTFGFAPPQIDHAWDGSPIVMGGVRYEHGIGTHAWCRMTYAVPPQATTFQAIVGLSDDVRECGAGAVTFEVRDDNDAVRFDSGLVDATTPARSIQADVRGTQTITLVVTEGGNGRDCDHANWALPAFLLPTP